ncbi:hypothetical protein AOQ84DRAFT_365623, partial [Glonium stellatum]
MQRHVQPAPVQQQNSPSEAAPAPVLLNTTIPATPPPMAEVPDTYRGRLSQFRILEESRHALIEELLDKLESAESRLQQTELDLQSEQNVRRRLQSEVVEAKERENALVEKA